MSCPTPSRCKRGLLLPKWAGPLWTGDASPCRRSSSESSGSGRRSRFRCCAAPRSLPPGTAWPVSTPRDPRSTPTHDPHRISRAARSPGSARCRSTKPSSTAARENAPTPNSPAACGAQELPAAGSTVAGRGLAIYWSTAKLPLSSDWLGRHNTAKHLGKIRVARQPRRRWCGRAVVLRSRRPAGNPPGTSDRKARWVSVTPSLRRGRRGNGGPGSSQTQARPSTFPL